MIGGETGGGARENEDDDDDGVDELVSECWRDHVCVCSADGKLGKEIRLTILAIMKVLEQLHVRSQRYLTRRMGRSICLV